VLPFITGSQVGVSRMVRKKEQERKKTSEKSVEDISVMDRKFQKKRWTMLRGSYA